MKRLFKLFDKENSVRGASILLMVTLTLSNILGLFRDRFLAKNIATSDLDIYYASFRIPDLIFNFLILGAITSAFIPIFSDFLAQKKKDEAFKVATSLINIAAIFTIAAAVILFFAMPLVMPLIVPSFDQARLEQTIRFSRYLMITPVFFSVSYILGGILNSFQRFLAYALAPLVYNLSIIVGAAFYGSAHGVNAIILFVIIGAGLHMLVQLPGVIKLGFKYRFSIDLRHPALKRILRLMIPRTIGMGVNQIMLVAFTAIASALAAGSIAAFELSNNIQTMPTVVFGTSFATAVFPTLTLAIASGDRVKFASYLNRTLRSIGFLLIPSTVIFILLRAQIVRLILGSGKFSWDDTRKTALTLGFFAISLLAQGLVPVLARAFYACKNTRTPMYVSIVSVVISVACAYPLSREIGVPGLALAFSIGSFVNAGMLLFYLRKNYRDIWNKDVLISYSKIIAITLVMAVAMYFTMHFMAGQVDMNRFFGVLAQALATVAVGFAVYVGLSYFFDFEEMKWAFTRKFNGEEQTNRPKIQ